MKQGNDWMIEQLKKRIDDYKKQLSKINPDEHISRLKLQTKIEELELLIKQQEPNIEEAVLKEIDDEIKNYHWMIQEVKRIKEQLEEFNSGGLTAQYGIAASMPKAGGISNHVSREVIRREKRFHYYQTLIKRVERLEAVADILIDPKERMIYENLLDGVTVKSICRRTKFSRSYVFSLKKRMLKNIAKHGEII